MTRKTFVAEPNPWHPMSEAKDVKVIGKFLEELGEGVSSSARCLIQGILECEPSTGELNKDWLQKEVADVLGNAELVIEHFGLNYKEIRDRAEFKKSHLRKWHNLA